jgi:RNA polymerase sigma-70 factor (ECF subfamily)
MASKPTSPSRGATSSERDVLRDAFASQGRFDTRYAAFIETLRSVRGRLHRYCARMTGSVFDGEDVAQEAIFEAYRKLDQYDATRPLAPWLFRIAHNRCIDFVRSRNARLATETAAAPQEEGYEPVPSLRRDIDLAFEHLVTRLPPKERACVLLKDLFDHSLEETADIVASTVGGVKSALKRGRTKLAAMPASQEQRSPSPPPAIHALYVELFNSRDWDGLRSLIRDDARLRISDVYAGAMRPEYFTTFLRMPHPFRMVLGAVDAEPVLMLIGGLAEGALTAIVRLELAERRIAGVQHYARCPWLLKAAGSVWMDGVPRAIAASAPDAGTPILA